MDREIKFFGVSLPQMDSNIFLTAMWNVKGQLQLKFSMTYVPYQFEESIDLDNQDIDTQIKPEIQP